MQSEYGLFIIWHNARTKEKAIIEDIKKRFDILNIIEIEWTKELFSKNLTRFYGENLPKNSDKEKHCGNGNFILVVIRDNNPLYGYRSTSKGKKYLNINLFDSKSLYRSWTGSHMVHGTNDMIEFKHDLMMLLGLSFDDYLCKYEKSENVLHYTGDVVGNAGFSSLEHVFYVLNETIPYVVLRNFELLPDEYVTGIHSDIDILCTSRNDIVKILNAKARYRSRKRACYSVSIGDSYVNFDFRYLGDDYYDKIWEKDILDTRIMKKNFYTPNDINFRYSLLYHALVQKRKIATDYMKKFNELFNHTDIKKLKNKLDEYMKIKNYDYVDSDDYSVYFNNKITCKRMRIFKKFYFFFVRIFHKVKVIFNEKTS